MYYYRKEREGSHVRSVYVGCISSEHARFISQIESMRRSERDTQREVRGLDRRLREMNERQDATLDMLAEVTETLTVAALLTTGFHTHKRQWRRKRQ